MKNKIALLAFLLASQIYGQDKKQNYSFSLDEALSFALSNNRTAVKAGRDIEIAQQKKRETKNQPKIKKSKTKIV
jgi:hypothetical protein